MSKLEALANRVLVVGYEGLQPPEELRRSIADDGLAGAILFRRNIDDPHQASDALAQFESALPPLLAVDQEGGRVQRLFSPFLELPPMRDFGERDDVALTELAARSVGEQLAAVGFNLNFAPVLDVDTNPDNPVIGDRSFSRHPETVARHAIAFARGLRQANVLSCGKHFPGHGDTDLDSHLALPRLPHDRERLQRIELLPFARASAEVDSIMTAHVVFEAIDKELPATLCPQVIDGLLRKELGFSGLIVSDDLEMKAVSETFGVARSAVMAIDAGCDLLLVCRHWGNVEAARDALASRAGEHVAFRAKLERAAARVDDKRGALAKRARTTRAERDELFASGQKLAERWA